MNSLILTHSVAAGTAIADRRGVAPENFTPGALTDPCMAVSSHTARAIH